MNRRYTDGRYGSSCSSASSNVSHCAHSAIMSARGCVLCPSSRPTSRTGLLRPVDVVACESDECRVHLLVVQPWCDSRGHPWRQPEHVIAVTRCVPSDDEVHAWQVAIPSPCARQPSISDAAHVAQADRQNGAFDAAFARPGMRTHQGHLAGHPPPVYGRPRAQRLCRGAVSTIGPSLVTAMVCSKWAPREPSELRRVQPSSSMQ